MSYKSTQNWINYSLLFDMSPGPIVSGYPRIKQSAPGIKKRKRKRKLAKNSRRKNRR